MPRIMTLNNKTSFGKLVVKKLMEMEKNQKYLAQEAGLSQFYVVELLKGTYNPSVKTLYRISEVTGIGIEELTKALLEES